MEKNKQKQLITEIMNEDAKDGLYKKQTAVEWLEKNISLNMNPFELIEYFNKAKQMEKEQIEDAHIEGQRVFDKYPHTEWTNNQAEIYYEQTYGK